MKQSIKNNITQIFLIVFSVFLGLYLSNRLEEVKEKKEASKLLSKIKAELNENKKLLDSWVPYHREIIKSLDSLSNSKIFIKDFTKDKSVIYNAFSRGTLMSDMPAADTWDIAKSHPIILNFDYDELLSLSKVYNQQKFTYESIPKLIELMLSNEFNSEENAQKNLHLFKDKLKDIYSREIQLINYYNNAEKILKYESM